MADSDFLCLFCGGVIPEDEVLNISIDLAHYQRETPGPGQILWAHLNCFQSTIPEGSKWLLDQSWAGPKARIDSSKVSYPLTRMGVWNGSDPPRGNRTMGGP